MRLARAFKGSELNDSKGTANGHSLAAPMRSCIAPNRQRKNVTTGICSSKVNPIVETGNNKKQCPIESNGAFATSGYTCSNLVIDPFRQARSDNTAHKENTVPEEATNRVAHRRLRISFASEKKIHTRMSSNANVTNAVTSAGIPSHYR
jgi:hypothetical protein